MRCRACNVILTDFEATRKSNKTGEYIDMCNACFYQIKDDLEVIEREDLRDEILIDEGIIENENDIGI